MSPSLEAKHLGLQDVVEPGIRGMHCKRDSYQLCGLLHQGLCMLKLFVLDLRGFHALMSGAARGEIV